MTDEPRRKFPLSLLGRPAKGGRGGGFPISVRLTTDGRFVVGLILLCLATGAALPKGTANVPLLAAFALAALLFVSGLLGSACLRKVSLSRRLPPQVFAFSPVEVFIQLRNAGALPTAAVVVQETLLEAPAEEEEEGAVGGGVIKAASGKKPVLPPLGGKGRAFVPLLPPGGTARTICRLTVRRRGVYVFAPVLLETSFPFGLFRHAVELKIPGRLTVYPRPGKIKRDFLRELERVHRPMPGARPGREEYDFRGLREFRSNDNPKWIHWPSSAKLDELLVREYEEPRARRTLLLLDTHMRRLGARRTFAFEAALSFAAALAWETARRRCRLTCLALPGGKPPAQAIVNERRPAPATVWKFLAELRGDNERTLDFWRGELKSALLRNSYVIVLGLGSLRGDVSFSWLRRPDNTVKIIDVRGSEFRRIFHRGRRNIPLDLEDAHTKKATPLSAV